MALDYCAVVPNTLAITRYPQKWYTYRTLYNELYTLLDPFYRPLVNGVIFITKETTVVVDEVEIGNKGLLFTERNTIQ